MSLFNPRPDTRTVIDFGLRDVGMRAQPVRSAARHGMSLLAGFITMWIVLISFCVAAAILGVGRWAIPVFAVLIALAPLLVMIRVMRNRPPTVVKIYEDGTDGARRRLLAIGVLLGALAVVLSDPLLAIPAAWILITVALIWRHRKIVPEVLAQIRSELGPGETVIGDASGLDNASRIHRRRGHIVVATNRRLLIVRLDAKLATQTLISLPYGQVANCHHHWSLLGLNTTVSMRFNEGSPWPQPTLTLNQMTAMNAMSIVAALEQNGVQCTGPRLDTPFVPVAPLPAPPAQTVPAPIEYRTANVNEQIAHALRQANEPRRVIPPFSQTKTPEFDRGLWICIALSGVLLYSWLLGIGFSALTNLGGFGLLVAVLLVSGYLSRTAWSVLYLVPLELLLTPLFFYTVPGDVLIVMATMAVIGLVCLPLGAAIRAWSGRGDKRFDALPGAPVT